MKARIPTLLAAIAALRLLCCGRVEARSESQKIFDPAKVQQGGRLFGLNCAHCHGVDASGDEGPDLRGVTKSDAKIATLNKQGIKGEMPKFERKLSDTDVQALIAFIRSLKE